MSSAESSTSSSASSSSTSVEGRCCNFNAGPAQLPVSALSKARSSLLNYEGTGMSVMELSHRSSAFESILAQTKRRIQQLLRVPDTYRILFLQGGGTGQFAAIPLNFAALKQDRQVDYLITGSWSKAAADEAKKYANVNIVASSEADKFRSVAPPSSWRVSSNASYFYYCHNETVHGVELQSPTYLSYLKQLSESGVPVIADVSSCFMSISASDFDVSQFACVYAGAQKNVGPAGVTIVIVNEKILGKVDKQCPLILDYTLMADKDSLYNTPPCFAIYMCGLVFEWMEQQGGLDQLGVINRAKSTLLYDCIDKSNGFYQAKIKQHDVRSRMNVVFDLANDTSDGKLVKEFVKEAAKVGLEGLAGHRSVGGCRASLYNAVSLEQVQRLVDFMKTFQARKQQEPTAKQTSPL